MASTSKCEYCGSTVRSDQEKCPNCDAPNPLFVVDKPEFVHNPKTIAELQEFCAERGMPLLRMRFFIGEDTKERKAFGIYRDRDGQFVVYKNKADGTRFIRYRGTDEQDAVREIYKKLLEECHKRGIYPENDGAGAPPVSERMYKSTGNKSLLGSIFGLLGRSRLARKALIAIIIIIILAIIGAFNRDGYYQYGSSIGYKASDDWYEYDYYYNDWVPASSGFLDAIEDSYDDYYVGNSWSSVNDYNSSYDYGSAWAFEDSDYYSDWNDNSWSSWDSSDLWDSWDSWDSYDSWDFGGSDWDSDW